MTRLSDRRRARRVDFAQDVEPALRAITALEEIHGTGNTILEDEAAKALSEGREAWWSLAPYHNAKAVILAVAANQHGVEFALDAGADDTHVPAATRVYLLGTLIPLNRRAEEARERAIYAISDEFCQMARAKRRAA